MNNKYINLEVTFPSELKDFILADLSELPFLGIVENENDLIVSFNKSDFTDTLLEEIQSILGRISYEIGLGELDEISEENWNENWEKEVPAITVSDKIGIAPEWKKHELNTEIKIIINPKMSFGTGSHETTKLCSLMFENTELKGKRLLDAGTGTGVLAILGKLLGAKEVIAFDNNEWSIRNATENFALNNLTNKIELDQFDLDEQELPKADIIVANILAHVIKRNMSKFANALNKGSTFIASGILIEQEEMIISTAVKHKLNLIDKIHLNEWTVLKFEKL